MKFLEFTFQSFWHFTGMLFLIATSLNGIAAIIGAFRNDPKKSLTDELKELND